MLGLVSLPSKQLQSDQRIEVHVGWLDIVMGRKESPGDCAIARAVRRATGEQYVRVDGSGIHYGTGRSDTSQACREFIARFDGMVLDARPFSFVLE